jgi:hypothetical protein
MTRHYGVYESVMVGSQADPGWFMAPIRYAKEDGSDGVVRVSASNLNFNYVRFEPTATARRLTWDEVRAQVDLAQSGDSHKMGRRQLYKVAEESRPGVGGRPEIPFAILDHCAHSGDTGVVTGLGPRKQLLPLLDSALKATPDSWSGLRGEFMRATRDTYGSVRERQSEAKSTRLLEDAMAQYEGHAQVIVRLRDQDGRPVRHSGVFFDNVTDGPARSLPFVKLVEDKHVNELTPNIATLYLRTDKFNAEAGIWENRLSEVKGCYLEVTATEPQSDDIAYLPFWYRFSSNNLLDFIRPNQTTIVDIVLLRVPSPSVYRMMKY